MSLLKGDSGNGTLDFQVGAYGGEQNRIQFDASNTDATAENLGISGTAIMEKSDAWDNLERIDSAIDKVSGFRANMGAIQSRWQTSANNLETQSMNKENARSRIEDTDYAASSAKIASINIMKAAGTAVLSQANDLPMGALKLVG